MSRRTLAFDPDHLLQRSLETVPGVLIWGTLAGLSVLAVRKPAAIAIFLIVYDLYWLVRAVYIATHLLASYRTLRARRGIDWLKRLDLLDQATAALPLVRRQRDTLASALLSARERHKRQELRRRLGQEHDLQSDLTRRAKSSAAGEIVPRWRDIVHLVILPSFREPLRLLEQSLEAIRQAEYPRERLWVVVALEERAGAHATTTAEALAKRYAAAFGRFAVTLHPDGIAGERAVKSANATWAAKLAHRELVAAGIPLANVLVSNFDADTVVSKDYFGALTYAFLTTPDRLRCSYQPLPLYHNNIWEAPAFTRVIATNSTFWLLIECTRPERLVTYSSHAMPFAALADVGYWDPTVVSEDSRIFWQCYVHYGGRYRTVPLYTTVSMDVTTASSLRQTFVNQYRQKRRWAWGIENFPYLVRAFARQPAIPRRDKIRHVLTLLEAWHSWATAALIIAGLGWLPIFFGGATFQQTVLAFSLPRVTRTILTIATTGLLVNMSLSLLLLPPPPPGVKRRQYLWMVLQWGLVPLIAWTLGSVPVLDAVTRLLLGRYLGFFVTPKLRVTTSTVVAAPAAVAAR